VSLEIDTASCERCDGSGWVENEEGAVQRCDCWLEGRMSRRLSAARIPPRYQHCTLDNFDDSYPGADRSLQSAKLHCEKFVEAYPSVRHGLLFTGPVGVGKTHLAAAVLRAIVRSSGRRGVFADYRDLLRQIQDSYNPVAETSELQILRPLLDADVLLLDELGARRPTAWVRDTVTHLLNDRYNREKITLITTNYGDASGDGEAGLEERIGERLRSRLHEMCKQVRLAGKDFRREVKGPAISGR